MTRTQADASATPKSKQKRKSQQNQPANSPTPTSAKRKSASKTGSLSAYPELISVNGTADRSSSSLDSQTPSLSATVSPCTLTTLSGGRFARCSVVFTKDERYIFCAVASHIKVYSVATGLPVRTLSTTSGTAHSALITSLQLNHANHLQLFSSSLDGTIRLWDINDSVLLKSWEIGSPITHMRLHPNNANTIFLAVTLDSVPGAKDSNGEPIPQSRVIEFDTESNSGSGSISERSSDLELRCIALDVSPNAAHVVAATRNELTILSSLSKSWRRRKLDMNVTTMALHPTEPCVALGDALGKITLWYGLLTSHKSVTTTSMHWHAHAVNHIAFTDDGSYALSGGEEAVLVLWQLQTREKQFLPRLGAGADITSISVSPSGSLYAVLQGDNSVRVVSSLNLSIRTTISGLKISHPTAVEHPLSGNIVVEPKHQHLVANGLPGVLQFFDPSADHQSFELDVCPHNRVTRVDDQPLPESHVTHVAFSPSGAWMATLDRRENEDADAETYLKFWGYNTDTQRWILHTRVEKPHAWAKGTALAFKPRQEEIAVSAGMDGSAKLWKMRDSPGKEVYWSHRTTVTHHGYPAQDAAFSHDGSILAVCHGPIVSLWDGNTGTLQTTLSYTPHHPMLRTLFISPNSPYMFTWSKDYLHCWNLLTCTAWWTIRMKVRTCAIHPRSAQAVVAVDASGGKSKVYIFEPKAPVPVRAHEVVGGRIVGMVFRSDDEVLVVNDQGEIQKLEEHVAKADAGEVAKVEMELGEKRGYFSNLYGSSVGAVRTEKKSAMKARQAGGSVALPGFLDGPSHALAAPSRLFEAWADYIMQPGASASAPTQTDGGASNEGEGMKWEPTAASNNEIVLFDEQRGLEGEALRWGDVEGSVKFWQGLVKMGYEDAGEEGKKKKRASLGANAEIVPMDVDGEDAKPKLNGFGTKHSKQTPKRNEEAGTQSTTPTLNRSGSGNKGSAKKGGKMNGAA
ncbi:hypothetical protein BJ742DRAFT_80102 [Cladochytrium replicatum]|nr:hypothetical protein BJ742DRAFT_80102 [Cladochytrium replicatum]